MPYSNRDTSQSFWNIVDVFVKEVINKDVVVFNSMIDITKSEDLRKKTFEERGEKPSYTSLVVKAVSLALSEHPEANRLVINNKRIPLDDINAVVAVEREVKDLGQIVLSAHLKNTDQRTLADISENLSYFATTNVEDVKLWKDFIFLIEKVPKFVASILLKLPTRSPSLWKKWRGGSFVITSPAKYGVDSVSAVWHYPLTIAFGLIKERPVVVDGKVMARSTLPLTLAWDRRLMPGAPAARFFNSIVKKLENAELE